MWCDCGIIPIQTHLRSGKSAKSKNDRYAKMTNMPVKRTNIDFYAINFQNLTWSAFSIPRHTLVARYYVIPFGVCPSVRAHHHGIFSNVAYILLLATSGMGLLMGKIRPFLTELLPFFVLEKCYSFTVHDI